MDAGAGATRLAESAQYLTGWLAAIVAVLTLAIIVFGFVSFAYFRHVTKLTSETVARETAERIAEQRANEYLQTHLPAILNANREAVIGQAGADEGERVAEDP
jgi:heme/copper-type cytochrome/quinol oxidase subunit 2